MASLLNRILTLLGRTASKAVSDALAQKPPTPSGLSEGTAAGSAEAVPAQAARSSIVLSAVL